MTMNDAIITRSILLGAFTGVFLLAAAPAIAQSNSLFRGVRRATPAPAQPPGTPATGSPARAATGSPQPPRPAASAPLTPPAGPRIRPPVLDPAQPVDPAPNPMLLAYSPIAVEAPKKERIKVGNLVTIIVRETKQALTDSNLRSEKQWDIEAELKKWLRIDGDEKLEVNTFPRGTPGVELDSKDTYRGRGRVDRRDELTTRITATVIDIKPNGTLLLEAKKVIKVDEETQTYTLTGVCRTEDLTPQNTVLSTQVADLHVEVAHSGAARDATRRNIFKQLVDLLQLN